MSTRACIKIKASIRLNDDDKKLTECVITLYHHSDGYPDGVGKDLKRYLRDVVSKWSWWMPEDIATNLVRGELDGDTGYEVAICEHADCEYGYLIDCDNETLTCYELSWGVKPWKEVVPIPEDEIQAKPKPEAIEQPAEPKEYHGGDEVWSKVHGKNVHIMLAHRSQEAGTDKAKVDYYLTTEGYPLNPDEVEDKH